MGGGLFDRLDSELGAREKASGLSMSDVLSLPDDQRKLFNWIMREHRVELVQVAAHLGLDAAEAKDLLSPLVEQGFLRQTEIGDECQYQVRLAPKRGRDVPVNIWQALGGKVEDDGGSH